MKIIAIEEHSMNREIGCATHDTIHKVFPYYGTFLAPHSADKAKVASDPFELNEKRVKEMEASGIDMEIMSYPDATQWLSETEALDISRKANNMMYENIKAFPNHFKAFATLPWVNPQEAANELRRTVNELGFVGTLISGRPQTGSIFLDDKSYYPVWEALTELDLPIYIHPNFPTTELCKSYYSGFDEKVNMVLSTYGWGWHLEAGIQVLRMIIAGVFDKFPTLKIISGHWGEIIPYYLPRIDQKLSKDITGLPEDFSTYYKNNVWVTPSGVFDNDNLEYCVHKLGVDHILFSADFPYLGVENTRAFFDNAPLTEKDKELIAYRNAEKLFHI